MVSLYLVRHGQTDASLANRYGTEGFVEIAVSPLLRARQTAEPTARRAGLALTLDDDLVEIAYGDWEDRAEAEVARDDAERFAAWADHPGRVAPPGGETGADIARRALAAVDRIRARHPDGGKVLVVSHKATLRVLVC